MISMAEVDRSTFLLRYSVAVLIQSGPTPSGRVCPDAPGHSFWNSSTLTLTPIDAETTEFPMRSGRSTRGLSCSRHPFVAGVHGSFTFARLVTGRLRHSGTPLCDMTRYGCVANAAVSAALSIRE